MSNPSEKLYQESLIESLNRPHFQDCPDHYTPNIPLIERLNGGEFVSQQLAFEEYFRNMQEKDPDYLEQLERIEEQRIRQYGNCDRMGNRALQIIVPAYREGENMECFLTNLKNQLDQSESDNWGVTVVMDYSIPYRNPYEHTALQGMETAIADFRNRNPQYSSRIDSIRFTRRKSTDDPILPVGFARKVGSDIAMLETFRNSTSDGYSGRPLYIGLMDMDTREMTAGLIHEMAQSLPESQDEQTKIIRVRGSFDRDDVAKNPFLHPLQVMWEGSTSEVGLHTNYNPFTVGRLSAVPARELAITGGGFPKKLEFPDEDIRHGIQIASHFPNVKHAEMKGRYSTSARREVNMVLGIMDWLKKNGGTFDFATMEIGALVRMYGDWSGKTYRRELQNVFLENDSQDGLPDDERFVETIPPNLIEALTNATYRFALHAMYSIDVLATSGLVPEIGELREQFLAGKIPHFRLELDTMTILRKIATENPNRFQSLQPLMLEIDLKARASTRNVLEEAGIAFEEDEEPVFGLMELAATELSIKQEREVFQSALPNEAELQEFEKLAQESIDTTLLRAPFHILDRQSEYMARVRNYILKNEV